MNENENEILEENKKIIKPKKVEKKKNEGPKSVLISIISLFIGALAMYLIVYYIIPQDKTNTVINKSEKEVTVTDKGIADAVEKLYDAVVVVGVYSNNQLTASGTGFVYKTDNGKAYILTNHHVIEKNKSDVKVIFTNGKEVEVKIEGSDKYSDLAVLSVDEKDIVSVAKIGKSTDLRLGDTTFAIGAPLDVEYYWTITRGVISGKDRMVEVSFDNSNTKDYVMRVLQTDAAINSGNSGGPLANSNGEVIGITNMKLVSNGVEGIGFAIPIEDAVEFADAIIKGEESKRPSLGVSMINLTDTYNLYYHRLAVNTELTQGVVIAETQSKSPAENAGLKRGDIVTSIDGETVKSAATMRYYLYKHSVGDTITIEFERDGKKQETKVKLTVAAS